MQTRNVGSKVNFLPADNEIPLVEIQKSPIQEEILVKPLLTALKRPQTSDIYKRNL